MSRLKGKPFEILAVSLDDTSDEALQAVKVRKIPGIHTWDKKGWESDIRLLYNIQNVPGWYLIDRSGVIRAKDPFGDKLIPAVEAALKTP